MTSNMQIKEFLADEAKFNNMIDAAFNNASAAFGTNEVLKECLFTAFISVGIENGIPEPNEVAIAEFSAAAEACGLQPGGMSSREEFRSEVKAIFSKVAETS